MNSLGTNMCAAFALHCAVHSLSARTQEKSLAKFASLFFLEQAQTSSEIRESILSELSSFLSHCATKRLLTQALVVLVCV